MRAGCGRRGWRGRLARLATALVLPALVLPAIAATAPAAAAPDAEPAPIVTAELGGGFIEFLFGRGGALRPEPEPRRTAPAAPSGPAAPPAGPSGGLAGPAAPGVGTTFCVRTCDGYAFPLGTLRGRGDADLHRRACAAACPGTPTALFVGSRAGGFASARALDGGTPYTALATAFLHRRERVPGCDCATVSEPAGRWAQGDATLRRGDVVVTAEGALVFDGSGLVDFRDGRAAGPALRRKIDDRLGLTAREERRAAWLRSRPAAAPVARVPGPSAEAVPRPAPSSPPLPPPRPHEPMRVAAGPSPDEAE
ncbi:DUF2865 domain-containing protein [Salinarimonas rosea]|uniref:DUF2865 domain-containing protein n=1 Tax=Salinarimonas rosea TaxID=552063 RepID=UPI00041CF2F3|nr:DUF2865 domain-containing protein [Salinarimonas rosea]